MNRSAYFVTLTYANEYIPSDGVCKRDVQLWLKRLRKNYLNGQLTYYIVSEYGPITLRPHYHAILFTNDPINLGCMFDYIQETWKQGIITCTDVCSERIAYCANYHITRGFCPASKNENFRLVSNGLGDDFFRYVPSSFFTDNATPITQRLGYRQVLPQFYRDRIHYTETEKERMRYRMDSNYLEPFSRSQIDRILSFTERIYNRKINKNKRI